MQELLSSAQVVGPSTIGVCQTVNTSPALSYQFFVEGNAGKCKYNTYTEAGCKGTATVNSLADDQFKCLTASIPIGKEAAILPLPIGVVSYKVTC